MRRFYLSDTEEGKAENYNSQGVGAMLRGAYREASFFLLSAVVCDPDFWPAFYNLGNTWARLGDDEAAIWAYQQAIRNCEEYAPLFLNLGILCCRRQQFKESLPYLEQAWRLSQDKPSAAVALGYAWYRLKEYGLAWHWYRTALRLDRNNKRIRESLLLVGRKILTARE